MSSGRLDRSDITYGRAHVLNATLIFMIIACLFYAVMDIFFFKLYGAAIVNAAAVVLSLFTLVFFKKTNNYRATARISIAILIVCLGAFFYVSQNRHFALYWLAILPPIVYFLLGIRHARIVLGIFGCYMLYFFLSGRGTWTPAEFDIASILNIAGGTLCLMLMIAFYEKSREEVWHALRQTNTQLENSQNELRLILDSSAEAIYGIDMHGNCTFCNKSCLEMLGYSDQSELLGKNMHWQIHHTRKDGTPNLIEDCKIFKAFIRGEGSQVDDEVFWRADGTSFDVEYFSYPQIKNGEITGAVITFMDISERKQKEAAIQYLSCYDTLTGLYNRRCFEENRVKIDSPDNLPLSVIFADINGLKMTNDIFGHTAGDELIKKSSEILKRACRQGDLIARVGGDEFIILLKKTTADSARKILARIKAGFIDARVAAIKCSISLGLDTKTSPDQSLDEIISNAENAMYRDKMLHRKAINRDIIDTIIGTLHAKNPREKDHSIAVSAMCSDMGTVLHLPQTEISKLKRAGYLHDIGKITLDDRILSREALSEDEREEMRMHPVVGYRILNLFDDTLDLAEYVYSHHEKWNGTGYPRGLRGEQIPLLSRIIAVAETYDRMRSRGGLSINEGKQAALAFIRQGAGTRFDPHIAGIFVRLIEKNEGA